MIEILIYTDMHMSSDDFTLGTQGLLQFKYMKYDVKLSIGCGAAFIDRSKDC